MVCSAVICCTHSTLSSWGVSVRLSVRSSCRCRLTHRQASAPDCRRPVHLSAPRLDITAVKWPKSCPARWPLPSPTTTRAFAVASLARQFRAVACIDLFAAALLKTSCSPLLFKGLRSGAVVSHCKGFKFMSHGSQIIGQ
jgi:hypothetical protein